MTLHVWFIPRYLMRCIYWKGYHLQNCYLLVYRNTIQKKNSLLCADFFHIYSNGVCCGHRTPNPTHSFWGLNLGLPTSQVNALPLSYTSVPLLWWFLCKFCFVIFLLFFFLRIRTGFFAYKDPPFNLMHTVKSEGAVSKQPCLVLSFRDSVQ